MTMLANEAVIIEILSSKETLLNEVLRILQLPWPAAVMEQLPQVIGQALLNMPTLPAAQLFYLVAGELYLTGDLGETDDYPVLHTELVVWLTQLLPKETAFESIASALLVMLESNQQLVIGMAGAFGLKFFRKL